MRGNPERFCVALLGSRSRFTRSGYTAVTSDVSAEFSTARRTRTNAQTHSQNQLFVSLFKSSHEVTVATDALRNTQKRFRPICKGLGAP